MQPKIKVEDNILIIEDKHGTKYLNVHDLKQLLGITFNAFFWTSVRILNEKSS